ncbi:MAG: hypothetical protein A3D34_00225 [Candidatus Staskawiczbacteria bacterium RIFCSPHIGHO2_02_FULL_33_16]|uniref:Uncharacterized protein n=1 Tax=Candidatus Staskawiczbacteria bacterium RIFCSPHIGHO2_02_FULL_33_16 TaxID=1802204 RepID=A0A1G2HWR6_9BACT|nr:MAG: hypothetical protein A3D34_00225 [Candidatus Staskawiczbacteria bacterium RIFCSPHIGHO2_02_FULL_33_16]OGZ70374.1 MAG: hypothetical protein A2980_00250 [Candidatus Staskawiczbacteria bacterium RIFCSPLOWO2_01_FULL_33_13]
MAQYKVKIYAEALVESILDKKNSANSEKITENFLKILVKNQDLKKAGEIINLASTLLLKKTNNNKIIFETARKIDKKDISKSFTKKGDIVEEKINNKIVAGIKIIVDNNRQLDFSLSAKLQSIFK